jgi:hypothetical protein
VLLSKWLLLVPTCSVDAFEYTSQTLPGNGVARRLGIDPASGYTTHDVSTYDIDAPIRGYIQNNAAGRQGWVFWGTSA